MLKSENVPKNSGDRPATDVVIADSGEASRVMLTYARSIDAISQLPVETTTSTDEVPTHAEL